MYLKKKLEDKIIWKLITVLILVSFSIVLVTLWKFNYAASFIQAKKGIL